MYLFQQNFNCGKFSTPPVEWLVDVRESHKNATVPSILKINQMKCGRVVIWEFWIGIF